MKKHSLFFVVAVMLFVACLQTSAVAQVDIKADEEALNVLMDSLDILDFESLMTEDALACGTDPSEFWNKQQWIEGVSNTINDAAPEINQISDRRIKVAADGNSAIVVTQYIISFSPKIPWRQVYHFVKTNDKWMIQFINVAFIPKNEDIQKINAAIE